MGRIVYGLSGEGRGHATRAQTVVELLAPEHEILLLAPNDAYHLLHESLSGRENITVQRIRGMEFKYSGKTLNYTKSVLSNLPFVMSMGAQVRELSKSIEAWEPQLAICDFEPLLPRVAHRLGIPMVSLDHQHFLTAMDLSCLPWSLRIKAYSLRPSVSIFCPKPLRQIVSSFYRYPICKARAGIQTVSTLLRRQIVDATTETGDHVVAYFRREIPQQVERALSSLRVPVKVFGVGVRPDKGMMSFHPTSSDGFLEQLRSCQALICTAGNQLIGEAFYMKKPVFAIPEPGNFEQALNAHFLPNTGGGEACHAVDVTGDRIRNFMNGLDSFRDSIDPEMYCGNRETVRIVSDLVQKPDALLSAV